MHESLAACILSDRPSLSLDCSVQQHSVQGQPPSPAKWSHPDSSGPVTKDRNYEHRHYTAHQFSEVSADCDKTAQISAYACCKFLQTDINLLKITGGPGERLLLLLFNRFTLQD